MAKKINSAISAGAARSTGAIAPVSGPVASISPDMLAQFNAFLQTAGQASSSTVQTVTAPDGSPVQLASRVMSDLEVSNLADSWFNGYGAIAKAARALHHGEMLASQCFTYFFAGREPGDVKKTQQAFNMAIRRLSDNALSFKVDGKAKAITMDATKSKPRAARPTDGTAAIVGDEPDAAGKASKPGADPYLSGIVGKPGADGKLTVPPTAPAASPETVSIRVISGAKTYLQAMAKPDRHAAAMKLVQDMAAMLASIGELDAGRDLLKAVAPAAPVVKARKTAKA